MIRVVGWLGVIALALSARWFDSDICRGASVLAAFGLIALLAPRALRLSIACLATVALVLLAATGIGGLLDALPALIAAFVAWLFARTLRSGQRPLIARAIAQLDGASQLDDPATVCYARWLTWIWTLWQVALAAFGVAFALHARGGFRWMPAWTPTPGLFGALILPLAVAGLFLGEFALRPLLLPQAPRHQLFGFVVALLRAWPRLLNN